MNKKVIFGTKPPPRQEPAGAGDNWVANRGGDKEPMKRLTFDVPESLHRAIKTACAGRGTKIRDEVVALLEAHYRGAPPEAPGDKTL